MTNLGATRYATSSAVATKPSSGGFFSWLTGESSSSLPHLGTPLVGVNLPPPIPDYVEPSKTKITTLPNGVKIASETSTVCMKCFNLTTSSAKIHSDVDVLFYHSHVLLF